MAPRSSIQPKKSGFVVSWVSRLAPSAGSSRSHMVVTTATFFIASTPIRFLNMTKFFLTDPLRRTSVMRCR
ncbi:hypothetical protein BJX65DRAFT_275393 [Aspergillus insuetus]